jgi:dCTP deaminase
MAFWSSERLRQNYTSLVPSATSVGTVEYGSIVLHVGAELYVTPHDGIRDPGSHTKVSLKEKECFSIPPGQFAFLLTEEKLNIPVNALGFISMKAKLKFKGLVNVSGFHVDPGYSGKLVFSAFNAGPSPIHLQRGLPLFLLWISDMDQHAVAADARAGKENYSDIPVELINNIPGKLYSLQGLSEKIDTIAQNLQLSLFKERVATWTAIAALLIGLIFRGPIAQTLGFGDGDLHTRPAAQSTIGNEVRPLPTTQPAAPPVQPSTPQVSPPAKPSQGSSPGARQQ